MHASYIHTEREETFSAGKKIRKINRHVQPSTFIVGKKHTFNKIIRVKNQSTVQETDNSNF